MPFHSEATQIFKTLKLIVTITGEAKGGGAERERGEVEVISDQSVIRHQSSVIGNQ
jgi:hypothetical protein